MSGIIVPILNKTRFEYSYLGGTPQSIIIQPFVNTSMFNRVQLIVRVHERNMTTGQSLVVNGFRTLPSSEDPREFVEPAALLTATVNGVTPSPTTVPGTVTHSVTDPGAFLKFVVTATQGATGATFYAELSAVLVLREF